MTPEAGTIGRQVESHSGNESMDSELVTVEVEVARSEEEKPDNYPGTEGVCPANLPTVENCITSASYIYK